MTRFNAFGQRVRDDAPELPGDFEVEDIKACEVYRDVQAPDLHFYLIHETEYGVRLVLEVCEHERGEVMRGDALDRRGVHGHVREGDLLTARAPG